MQKRIKALHDLGLLTRTERRKRLRDLRHGGAGQVVGVPR